MKKRILWHENFNIRFSSLNFFLNKQSHNHETMLISSLYSKNCIVNVCFSLTDSINTNISLLYFHNLWKEYWIWDSGNTVFINFFHIRKIGNIWESRFSFSQYQLSQTWTEIVFGNNPNIAGAVRSMIFHSISSSFLTLI